MYEGDNTTSSKPTMLQLKEHEQQQDNCSLIHMFWHHMLQWYSLRMRYFNSPAIFLASVNAPLSVGSSYLIPIVYRYIDSYSAVLENGRRSVVRARCGHRGHRGAFVGDGLQ